MDGRSGVFRARIVTIAGPPAEAAITDGRKNKAKNVPPHYLCGVRRYTMPVTVHEYHHETRSPAPPIADAVPDAATPAGDQAVAALAARTADGTAGTRRSQSADRTGRNGWTRIGRWRGGRAHRIGFRRRRNNRRRRRRGRGLGRALAAGSRMDERPPRFR